MKTRTCWLLWSVFALLLLLRTNALAFYDPGTQRWINRDPIQEKGGLNLFGFVRNKPISRNDPFGHQSGCGNPYALMGMGGYGAAAWGSGPQVQALAEALASAQQAGYPAQAVMSAAANEDYNQSSHIPVDEFVFAGAEFPIPGTVLDGEALFLAGINGDGPYWGGLGAIGKGLMIGKEWDSQDGWSTIYLLDSHLGFGGYHSPHGTGAFFYWPPDTTGFIGCGIGINH